MLKNLSELTCTSISDYDLINQLSQICHNLLSLRLEYNRHIILDVFADLISAQNKLKYLYIEIFDNLTEIQTHSLTKLPNTLTHLEISGRRHNIPLSFITKLTNLQVLKLSY